MFSYHQEMFGITIDLYSQRQGSEMRTHSSSSLECWEVVSVDVVFMLLDDLL